MMKGAAMAGSVTVVLESLEEGQSQLADLPRHPPFPPGDPRPGGDRRGRPTVDLLIGKVLPPGAKHVCIVRTGLIFISKLNEEQSLYGFWKLQQKTAALPPVGPKR
jgi:hypothetical protein